MTKKPSPPPTPDLDTKFYWYCTSCGPPVRVSRLRAFQLHDLHERIEPNPRSNPHTWTPNR